MPSIKYDHTTINYSGSVTSKKYIVWHDTGVKGQTAAGNANYFRSVDRQSSAHYFIDKNAIVEVVDPNLVAWHCGDGAGKYGITNANSIGIELCAEADGTIHAQTIANAIWLGKKLMKDFGISYNNNVRHYDASRKNCPQYLNTDGKWTKWYEFKAQLAPTATVTTETATVTAPVRNPVSYNATIASGGYSIDSKPWGEPGAENWGSTDTIVGNEVYIYEENYSGEYANAYQVGWIDKRAIEKAKTVIASTLFLPNGQQWIVYPEAGPYEVGEVVSIKGQEGSWYTILGDKGNDIVVLELQSLGKRAIFADAAKGATITQVLG